VRAHVDRAFTEAMLISLIAGITVAVLTAGLVTWLVARRLASPVGEPAAATSTNPPTLTSLPIASARPEWPSPIPAKDFHRTTRAGCSNASTAPTPAAAPHQPRRTDQRRAGTAPESA
jgi:hypothetical protein